MAYRPEGSRSNTGPAPGDSEARAYLADFAALLHTTPHPSVVLDRSWDVVLANPAFDALFARILPHPTAMPRDNLMRFVLFHPDAGSVLAEHESRWCLPMLVHLAQALDEHGQDAKLLAIRRDVARDPIMEAAYQQALPHWLRAVDPAVVQHDGSVRPLRHPDPRWGRTCCRVVYGASQTLDLLGYRHLTFVLREPSVPEPSASRASGARRSSGHLRVVPAADA